jgi:hypothetical protein
MVEKSDGGDAPDDLPAILHVLNAKGLSDRKQQSLPSNAPNDEALHTLFFTHLLRPTPQFEVFREPKYTCRELGQG